MLKPSKPPGDPKSYRPTSLLRIPYKIMKRLIYARIKPIIDPLLPPEQAGFRCGRSTVDQVIVLTQEIEDSFSAKKKSWCCVCRSHGSLRHRMAPRPHLQTSALAARQAHGFFYHGACPKLQLLPSPLVTARKSGCGA